MQSITKLLWGNGQSEVVTKGIAPGLQAYGRCGTRSTKPMLYDSEPLCVVQYMYIGALTDVEKYSTQLY